MQKTNTKNKTLHLTGPGPWKVQQGRMTAGIQGLASRDQARRVTDRSRGRRWEMVELRGGQQWEAAAVVGAKL